MENGETSKDALSSKGELGTAIDTFLETEEWRCLRLALPTNCTHLLSRSLSAEQ